MASPLGHKRVEIALHKVHLTTVCQPSSQIGPDCALTHLIPTVVDLLEKAGHVLPPRVVLRFWLGDDSQKPHLAFERLPGLGELVGHGRSHAIRKGSPYVPNHAIYALSHHVFLLALLSLTL
jgi:hypothetical protein